MFKKIIGVKKVLILILVLGSLFVGYKGYVYMASKSNTNNGIKEDTYIKDNNGELNKIEEPVKQDNIVTDNNENDKNVNKQEEISSNSNNKTNKPTSKPKDNNSSKPEDNHNNLSSTNNNVNSSQGTNINEEASTNNKTTQNNTPVTNTCTSSNSGWVSYIANWKAKNPEDLIYDTQEETIAYGNKAMNYGYGFWYDERATTYSDSECTKEFWTVNLYIPAGSCKAEDGSYNKMIKLPATPKENLVDMFQYLHDNGYDCSGKCTRTGVCF